MNQWSITINGVHYKVKATNAWTATTRAIKLYWQKRGNISALNEMDLLVLRNKAGEV